MSTVIVIYLNLILNVLTLIGLGFVIKHINCNRQKHRAGD